MKEIRNKSTRPVSVPLPGGKVLHLGPSRVAQISDTAIGHAGVQELIAEGTIEVLATKTRTEGSRGPGNVPGLTRGHNKSFRGRRGDR
jgi:hypothetical protein